MKKVERVRLEPVAAVPREAVLRNISSIWLQGGANLTGES